MTPLHADRNAEGPRDELRSTGSPRSKHSWAWLVLFVSAIVGIWWGWRSYDRERRAPVSSETGALDGVRRANAATHEWLRPDLAVRGTVPTAEAETDINAAATLPAVMALIVLVALDGSEVAGHVDIFDGAGFVGRHDSAPDRPLRVWPSQLPTPARLLGWSAGADGIVLCGERAVPVGPLAGRIEVPVAPSVSISGRVVAPAGMHLGPGLVLVVATLTGVAREHPAPSAVPVDGTRWIGTRFRMASSGRQPKRRRGAAPRSIPMPRLT